MEGVLRESFLLMHINKKLCFSLYSKMNVLRPHLLVINKVSMILFTR